MSAFIERVHATPLDESSSKIAGSARTAAASITRSFTLIEVTALDIVDMQVRLQGETARLASSLRERGDEVERQRP